MVESLTIDDGEGSFAGDVVDDLYDMDKVEEDYSI